MTRKAVVVARVRNWHPVHSAMSRYDSIWSRYCTVLSSKYGVQVRMVEARPGIAFVEFDNDMQASVAMQGLQNFKVPAVGTTTPMNITYAKQ